MVGMCICNDRRWPETYRVMGLQGVEMVLLGYNTPIDNIRHAPSHEHLAHFPQPSCRCRPAPTRTAPGWSASAKGGIEDGLRADRRQLPSSRRPARSWRRRTTEDDEVIATSCDLDLGRVLQATDLQFRQAPPARAYGLITRPPAPSCRGADATASAAHSRPSLPLARKQLLVRPCEGRRGGAAPLPDPSEKRRSCKLSL